MLRVPLDKLQPGMILARPVPLPNDAGAFLLQRDQPISLDVIPRLKRLGFTDVWVRCRNFEFLENLIDEEVSDAQRQVYQVVRSKFETLANGAALGMDLSQFHSTIGDLFSILKRTPHSGILLQKLDAFDNYLMSHSTNVCYLSLLIGLRLERYLIDQRIFKNAAEAKDLQTLGLGCILHDVGKMKIPATILHKPGRLTAEEMEVMKQHTVLGYEMVKGRVSRATADIVLNHHQRFDGKGYPSRVSMTGEVLEPLSGRRISVFSRIATIADVYDAATTKRCYSSGKLPVQVLHEIRTICKGIFDPIIERAFFEIIPPFPIGQIVMLNDGTEAVVVDFNPRRTTRPKVQCMRNPKGELIADPSFHEIDLALHPELRVASVNGVDVAPFLSDLERASDAPISELANA